jgi:ribulose-5-phosphate 4-epimerase/fuculose-1-phosphate aldolase
MGSSMSDRAVAMNNMVIDHEGQIQDSVNFTKLATELAETGKNFYSRGWVLGTSRNFSAVTSWQPLRLAISPTLLDKGSLTPAQFLEIDGASNVIRGDGRLF